MAHPLSSSQVVAPAALTADPARYVVVDIRPDEERRSALGFVPASLGVPWDEAYASDPERLLDLVRPADGETVVLTCTSGRRSGVVLARLHACRVPIVHLDGGVLRWTAEGLPTCGMREGGAEDWLGAIEDVEGFARALRACFVSEMVERAMADERLEGVDPVSLYRECVGADGDGAPSVTSLRRAIDRMAVTSRRMGTSLEVIAANTDRMSAMLDRLAG